MEFSGVDALERGGGADWSIYRLGITLSSGVTLPACGSLAMASASARVSVSVVLVVRAAPAPSSLPPRPPLLVAALMKSVLLPRLAIRWVTSALAPRVSVTAVKTAATPTMTPSMVSSERVRLTRRDSNALWIVALHQHGRTPCWRWGDLIHLRHERAPSPMWFRPPDYEAIFGSSRSSFAARRGLVIGSSRMTRPSRNTTCRRV